MKNENVLIDQIRFDPQTALLKCCVLYIIISYISYVPLKHISHTYTHLQHINNPNKWNI